MSELGDDLRAIAEDLAADAAELHAIEEEKATLDSSDPRVDVLSEEGERVAREIVPKTVAERRLAAEARDPDESADSDEPSNGRHQPEG
jgi:hypothetical protein